uniref:Lipase, hepatic a n=1 Tax=Sinocyclocheilus anshuiensis TaxID=1608454 RepID=A0A671P7A9_9TELE
CSRNKVLGCVSKLKRLNTEREINTFTFTHYTETGERMKMSYKPKSVFRLYTDSNIDDTCRVELFKPYTLDACGFNSSHPLAIIIHGWSVDGMMENWISRLASALKSSEGSINVMIADWLTLAHQHYPIAVQNTRIVGQDIAHLLRWLEVRVNLGIQISLELWMQNLFPKGINTTILTLYMELIDFQLSPEDARFVDAIHTFTQERMGLSVGIKQLFAHFDFYPNGGSFQPGCQLHVQNIYAHLAQYGIMGFEQTVKCAHERTVHLFIDSLLNKDKQIMAYKCSDNTAFEKGYCLDCRKNRCDTLGYDIKKVRTGTSKRPFLKTRSHMPYKLFHYQIRIQFINQTDKIEPTLTVSLTGTTGRNPMWAKMWSMLKTMIPWAKSSRGPQLTVGKITVKAGETQRKTAFCPQTDDGMYIEPSQEKVFAVKRRERSSSRSRG